MRVVTSRCCKSLRNVLIQLYDHFTGWNCGAVGLQFGTLRGEMSSGVKIILTEAKHFKFYHTLLNYYYKLSTNSNPCNSL